MTCKDCLHYEACTDMIESLGYTVGGDGFNAEKRCKCFADRSEWVHLPCKVGDIVWYITGVHHSLIKSARVEEILINETGIRELNVSTENGWYFQNDITIFYNTSEEAEKALDGKNEQI